MPESALTGRKQPRKNNNKESIGNNILVFSWIIINKNERKNYAGFFEEQLCLKHATKKTKTLWSVEVEVQSSLI